MKAIKYLSKTAASIVAILLMAAVLAGFGLPAVTSVTVSTVGFVAFQVMPKPAGISLAGLYPELWTGELVDKFRHEKSWLSVIPRRDELVKNNTIHLVDVGADPNVLVNNTTYPISSAQRTDADISIGLDKFDTENTRITKDELYGLPYDKPGSVLQDHRMSLEDKTAMKSYHSLSPANNASSNSPMIPTTGALDARTQSRKRITEADIIKAKEALDVLDIPLDGRILTLCTEHYNDLLLTNELFAKQYKDLESGKLLPSWYGFRIFQYNRPSVYTKAVNVFTKKAFGAAADPANEYKASNFFYAPRAFQAVGTAEMFYRDAATDPEYREHKVGFRLYHICLPKKVLGFGAIVQDA